MLFSFWIRLDICIQYLPACLNFHPVLLGVVICDLKKKLHAVFAVFTTNQPTNPKDEVAQRDIVLFKG